MRYFVTLREVSGKLVAIPVDLITAVISEGDNCVIHWDKYKTEIDENVDKVVKEIDLVQSDVWSNRGGR